MLFSGYKGDDCGTDINECDAKPCKNGECAQGVNTFTCKCNPGTLLSWRILISFWSLLHTLTLFLAHVHNIECYQYHYAFLPLDWCIFSFAKLHQLLVYKMIIVSPSFALISVFRNMNLFNMIPAILHIPSQHPQIARTSPDLEYGFFKKYWLFKADVLNQSKCIYFIPKVYNR